jgi:hypothetical protein
MSDLETPIENERDKKKQKRVSFDVLERVMFRLFERLKETDKAEEEKNVWLFTFADNASDSVTFRPLAYMLLPLNCPYIDSIKENLSDLGYEVFDEILLTIDGNRTQMVGFHDEAEPDSMEENRRCHVPIVRSIMDCPCVNCYLQCNPP